MRRILLRTAAAASAVPLATTMAIAGPAAASPTFDLRCDRFAASFSCDVRPVDPNLARISWYIDGQRRHAFDQQTVVFGRCQPGRSVSVKVHVYDVTQDQDVSGGPPYDDPPTDFRLTRFMCVAVAP
jgi:hypothetical protein